MTPTAEQAAQRITEALEGNDMPSNFPAAASPAALRALLAERAEWSDRTAEAQAERDAAREERDELLKDAARYRFVRDDPIRFGICEFDDHDQGDGWFALMPSQADKIIDAAMAALDDNTKGAAE